MPSRAVPPPIPSSCEPSSSSAVPSSNPRLTRPSVRLDSLGELPIRRYDMHWLQHAAASINRRSERTQRQRLLTAAILGVDHLFDMSDVPSRPHGRRTRLGPTSDPGVGR